MARRQRQRRKPRRTVFEVKIRQGTALIAANSQTHADIQARVLERDLDRRWMSTKRQTQVEPGLFVLGEAARQYRKAQACGESGP